MYAELLERHSQMNNFLSTADFSRQELAALIDSALQFKHGNEESKHSKPLAGKSLALVFFNPSLRTRASMQVGLSELGGN